MTARDQAISPFHSTLEEFCAGELLPFVFADAEDERTEYTMLIAQVRAKEDWLWTEGRGAPPRLCAACWRSGLDR